jgi:Nucleotide-diphospho-sugar transferase
MDPKKQKMKTLTEREEKGGSTAKLRLSSAHLSFASHLLVGLCCAYFGLTLGMSTISNQCQQEQQRQQQQQTLCPVCPSLAEQGRYSSYTNRSATPTTARSKPFPDTLKNMFVDFATIPRSKFNEDLDIGVPFDDTTVGAEEVLVLYTNSKSIPYGRGSAYGNNLGLDTAKALENCHSVKVILQEPNRKRKSNQCIAILPQWESYYVHKLMRVTRKPNDPVDLEIPLRYVSRSHSDKGVWAGVPSLALHTTPSYDVLAEYLQNLHRLMADLKPFLKGVMDKAKRSPKMRRTRTLVVMVCNRGQSALFHNFVCNVRARGLDLSRIVMFATDEYTQRLSESLGIATWYDATIFGEMPEAAARRYGDRSFVKMMLAKVYCVHLVLTSGYDVLFQDVDVVWHRNPVPFFDSADLEEWDMIFQDDGARSVRYQPYSPNTGFYFVRSKPATQFFFGMLMRMGDVIMATKSHQATLTSLLNEFVSWKGLRVKVWHYGRADNLFPGGIEYHRSKAYMRDFLGDKATIDPYIFHMSWTENKDNKKLFFEQMGEWYTKEDKSGGACSGLDCCLAQPNITCHYRDKPSKIPCPNSPIIDKWGKSFWV